MIIHWLILWLWVMLLWSIAALLKTSLGGTPLVPEPLYGVALALAFEAAPAAAVLFLGTAITAIDITNGGTMGPHPLIYVLLYAMAERLRFQFNVNRPIILFFMAMLFEATSRLVGTLMLGGSHGPPMYEQVFVAVTAGALAGVVTPFVYAGTRFIMQSLLAETKSYDLF